MYNTLKPTEGNPNSQLAKKAKEIVASQRAEAKRIQDEKLAKINELQKETRERIARERAEAERAIAEVAEKRAQVRMDAVKASARKSWRGSDESFEKFWTKPENQERVLEIVMLEEMKRENEAITNQSRAAQAIFNSNQ